MLYLCSEPAPKLPLLSGHFHPNLAGSLIAARNSAGVNDIFCMGIVDTEGSGRVMGIVEVVGRGIEVIDEGAEDPT